MEKTYSIKMYYLEGPQIKPDNQLYTQQEIIDIINNVTYTDSKTLDDAIRNLNEYEYKNKYRPTYIEHKIIKISNDDFVGNVKPDLTSAKNLDFGELKNSINKNEYIITEYSILNKEQKYTVCLFIDKNNQLLNDFKTKYRNESELLADKFKRIIKNFAHDMFLSLDHEEAEKIIKNMKVFNNIETDKLASILNNVVNNLTVKQLLDNDDDNINTVSNEFWNKIIEENNKEKELKNN